MSFLDSIKKRIQKGREALSGNVGYVLFFSAIVSIISSVVFTDIFVNSQNQKIKELSDTCQNLETKFKSAFESVKTLDDNVNSLKDDIKNTKDNVVRVFTDVAAIQKDLEAIKKEFHVNTQDNINESMKKLDSEKYNFLLSLENLIKEGMPFEDFIASFGEKIDMKKYSATSELLKFQDVHVKSVSELKKDISSFGASVFDLQSEEGFFEKQKRKIKEKIMDAIKIKKLDDESAKEIANDSDEVDYKKVFEKAMNSFSDGDLDSTVKCLDEIKIENVDLSQLTSDIRKRIELNKSFELFKEEFLDTETK